MKRRCGAAFLAVVAAGLAAGCRDATEPVHEPPVLAMAVELRSPARRDQDASYDLTCETADHVLLKATGSYDVAGKPLEYEWRDTMDGDVLTMEFMPRPNPMRVLATEVEADLYTIGIHAITLTVRAADGRRATATKYVKVMPCGACGGNP